tara:strand:+ start:3602 stop:4462 length:861 start_codon:yes stop_codon:yes gene_type:complete
MYDLNIISIGAGVQSTYLALNARQFGEPDHGIFADTGWEPDAVYEQLARIEDAIDFPLHRCTAGNIREDVLDARGGKSITYGQPPFSVINRNPVSRAAGGYETADVGGKIWRRCTAHYKIDPIQKEIRRLLGYKPRQRIKHKVRQWFGITTDEASRMKDSRVPWIDNWYPLIDAGMSRQDCLDWFATTGLPEPRKSACIGCPYHTNHTWADMKRHLPEEWAGAVAFDTALRADPEKKLPGVTGEAYLHRRCLPLEEAVIPEMKKEAAEEDQYTLAFGEECEGMCGV